LQTLHNAESQLQTLNLLLQEMLRLRQIPRLAQQQQQQQQQQNDAAAAPGLAATGSARPNPPTSTQTQPQNQPEPQPQLQQQLPPFAHAFPQQLGPFAQLPQFAPFAPRFSVPTVTRHGGAGYGTGIPAGSSELPEGVVIPPGWSLLPLQRLDGSPAPTGVAQPIQPQVVPQVPNHLPEILQTLAQQVQNAHGGPNGRVPSAQDVRGSETQSAPSTTGNTGSSQETTGAHTQQTSAGPSTDAHQTPPSEPPPVTAPTPVMPNWGGRSQLFGGGPSATFGYQLTPPSATPAQQEETVEGTGSEPVEQQESSAAQKGKAKAVTVEEADDGDDE
jgi:E3 ubiquitin-protein ligase synoviolin